MSHDAQSDTVAATLERLIPTAQVSVSVLSESNLKYWRPTATLRDGGTVGGERRGRSFTIWYRFSKGDPVGITISRTPISITKAEMELLKGFPYALAGLLQPPGLRAADVAARISSEFSLGNIIVARFLRRRRAANFGTPSRALALLQDLATESYEGHKVSSGFVYTSQYETFLKALTAKGIFFEQVIGDLKLTHRFFDKPASYRYVDGRNAFYLLDKSSVRSLVRLSDPSKFSINDRASGEHVRSLCDDMPGRPWIAFVGQNAEVHVDTRAMRLTWTRNHWRVRDPRLIVRALSSFGCNATLSQTLTSAAFALSDLRLSALMLVLRDSAAQPEKSHHFDNSELGQALRAAVRQANLSELMRRHGGIGILASDGLTILDQTGAVIDAGVIIKNDAEVKLSYGASGTQAGAVASLYGVAIKVSADGPISVFSEGKLGIRV
jgi:hypothetical protein